MPTDLPMTLDPEQAAAVGQYLGPRIWPEVSVLVPPGPRAEVEAMRKLFAPLGRPRWCNGRIEFPSMEMEIPDAD